MYYIIYTFYNGFVDDTGEPCKDMAEVISLIKLLNPDEGKNRTGIKSITVEYK